MSTYPPQFNQQAYSFSSANAFVSRISSVMKRVYLNMTLALIVTAVVSLLCVGGTDVVRNPNGSQDLTNLSAFMSFYLGNRWITWALVIAEFGIVIGVSAGINRLSTATATLLFYLFAVINGMMLSPIFLVYTGASIAKTFFITAGTFAAMSVYGFFTSRDLTKFGNILFMALIGIIIASLVNMFTRSTPLGWIISVLGVVIFVGLTAWDTQQIKRMAIAAPEAGVGRLAVLGALSLYLDFINLFLYLLRFFGSSRN